MNELYVHCYGVGLEEWRYWYFTDIILRCSRSNEHLDNIRDGILEPYG